MPNRDELRVLLRHYNVAGRSSLALKHQMELTLIHLNVLRKNGTLNPKRPLPSSFHPTVAPSRQKTKTASLKAIRSPRKTKSRKTKSSSKKRKTIKGGDDIEVDRAFEDTEDNDLTGEDDDLARTAENSEDEDNNEDQGDDSEDEEIRHADNQFYAHNHQRNQVKKLSKDGQLRKIRSIITSAVSLFEEPVIVDPSPDQPFPESSSLNSIIIDLYEAGITDRIFRKIASKDNFEAVKQQIERISTDYFRVALMIEVVLSWQFSYSKHVRVARGLAPKLESERFDTFLINAQRAHKFFSPLETIHALTESIRQLHLGELLELS